MEQGVCMCVLGACKTAISLPTLQPLPPYPPSFTMQKLLFGGCLTMQPQLASNSNIYLPTSASQELG